MCSTRPPPAQTIKRTSSSVVTVGSGCSGWNSELFALEELFIDYQHIFSSEINIKDSCVRCVSVLFGFASGYERCLKPVCCSCCLTCLTLLSNQVKTIAAMLHHPQYFYGDVCSDAFRSAPHVDIFFGGFPCQPFSTAGDSVGICDDSGRGLIVLYLARYIKDRLPAVFVLENVLGLVTQHPSTFLAILQLLGGIIDPSTGRAAYTVEWRVLNARVHGGLPQNRRRVFIVGFLTSRRVKRLVWPSEAPFFMRCVSCFLFETQKTPNPASDSNGYA